jgi:prepilin-type N-terminal cleavage/methylation domain-containing protein
MKSRGFSFVEFLVAMMILSVSILSLLWMSSYSKKGSMDAYYEFLAFSLAKEPIEVFRAFGYQWLQDYDSHPLARYPVNVGPAAIGNNPTDPDQHPFEASQFVRSISLAPADHQGLRAFKVTVEVGPAGKNRVETWLRKDNVQLEALIVETPK